MRTTPRASLHRIQLFLRSQFLDHPRSLRESYWEHHRNALHFAAQLISAGAACAVHALIPSLCSTVASDAIKRLHARMSERGRLSVHDSSPEPERSSLNYS